MSNLLNFPMNLARLCKLLSEKTILKLRLVCRKTNANISQLISCTAFRIFELSIRTTNDGKSEIEFFFERKDPLLRQLFLCKISFIAALAKIEAIFSDSLVSSYSEHRIFKTLRICLVPAQMCRFMAIIKTLLLKVNIKSVNSIGDENDPELIRMCMNFLDGRRIDVLIFNKENASEKIERTAWADFLDKVEVTLIIIYVFEFTKDMAQFFVQMAKFAKTMRIRVRQGGLTEYVTIIKQILNSKCERLYFEHDDCLLSLHDIEILISYVNGSNSLALGVSSNPDSFFEVQIGMFRIIGDPSDQSISMKHIGFTQS